MTSDTPNYSRTFRIDQALRFVLRALRVKLRDMDYGQDLEVINDREVNPTWWNQLIWIYYGNIVDKEEVPNTTQFQEATVPSGRRHIEQRPMFSMPMGSMVQTPKLEYELLESNEVVTCSPYQAYRHFVEATPNIDVHVRLVDNRTVTSSSGNSSPSLSPRPQRRPISGELVSSMSSETQGYRAFTDIYSVQPNVHFTGASNNENSPITNIGESCDQDDDEEEIF